MQFEEVRFYNQNDQLQLAGMLLLPAASPRYPAVVLIHGSGTSQRANRWYLTLAHHLQQQGIAVLLPDKRGSEKSEGEWRRANLETLANDTEAAIAYLRGRQLPISGISIIGLSQGGQIASIVASRQPELKAVVNVVGSALPMRETLVYEERHNLRDMGFLPPVADVLAPLTSRVLIHFTQRAFWQALGNFDALPYWRQVTQPILVIYGEQDTNVPSRQSAERLQSLRNPLLQVIVYPGSGHAIEDPIDRGDQLFRHEALMAVSEFIHQHNPPNVEPSMPLLNPP